MTIAWAYSADEAAGAVLRQRHRRVGPGQRPRAIPRSKADIENSMMIGFRKQHHPEEAIFFGLDAVNSYQQIRKNISGLDKELQAGFAQSQFRRLSHAGRTARRGRPPRRGRADSRSAQRTGAERPRADAAPGASAGIEPLKLSPAQQNAESALPDLEKKARTIEESSLAYAQLQAKPSRTPDEDAQLKSLSATIQQASKRHSRPLSPAKSFPSSMRNPPRARLPPTPRKAFFRNSLAKLGPHVMGIRLLLGDDHAYAIVVTANSRKKYRSDRLLPPTFAAKALEALKAVGSPSSDPRPQLNQLYAMVVAPIEGELKTARIHAGPERQRSHSSLVARRRIALRAHGRALRRQPLYGRALPQCSLHSRELRPHDRFAAPKRSPAQRAGHGPVEKLRRTACSSRRHSRARLRGPRSLRSRFARPHAGQAAARRAVHAGRIEDRISAPATTSPWCTSPATSS